MPETCTCGSQLPPDAVFCHKCGKPQREIVVVEPEAPTPPPLPPPTPVILAPMESAPVNFRNMDAVKTSLMAAVLATLLSFLPIVNCILAGYFAVLFYRRRIRQSVDVISGARIGWLTGLMAFPMLSAVVALELHSPSVLETMTATQKASYQQVLSVMQNGPQLAAVLAMALVFVTILSTIGGLLGAVLTGRVSPRPRGGNTV
jgi:hypothetical protein